MADSEFEAGQVREALNHFTLLEQRYQDSEVAWAAAMRAAQLTQSLGEPEAAAKSFARVASMYSASRRCRRSPRSTKHAPTRPPHDGAMR